MLTQLAHELMSPATHMEWWASRGVEFEDCDTKASAALVHFMTLPASQLRCQSPSRQQEADAAPCKHRYVERRTKE